jgi:predicted permease
VTGEILVKLAAILLTVALGWVAGRLGWLGRFSPREGIDPARVLSNAAFYLFVPALLFRTMVRQDLASMPWRTLLAYFVPATVFTLALYGWWRHRGLKPAAAPATRTVAAVYGNAAQLGIPMAAALFGEAGLALHISLVSLHGVVLLTMLTVLVENDLARVGPTTSRWETAQTTLRNAIVHPVVLPVLAGLLWNFTGLGLHPVVDQTLLGLGSAVVPVCLVLIGVSLAMYGIAGGLHDALVVSAWKLLAMPALVLVVAHWGFGLSGIPLSVLVMMAALPTGNNALIFAQRYETLQAEATLAILVSTTLFVVTAALWLTLLGLVGS